MNHDIFCSMKLTTFLCSCFNKTSLSISVTVYKIFCVCVCKCVYNIQVLLTFQVVREHEN